MELKEIQKACRELAGKIGPKAEVSLRLNGYSLTGSIYTKGICGDRDDVEAFQIYTSDFDTFEETLAYLEKEYASEAEKRAGRIIEKMALEIIRITAEFGSCTDASLRSEFGPAVAKYADLAVSKANEMAANGPFSIVAVAGANMMAAE